MIDEDREAVRRVQRGETEAFEVLVEKYKRKTFRLAFGVLRDQEEALDVAQEAFVKAFRALPNFKGDSAFYTWLFRITMNLALDRKRQRATRARSMGAEDVPPEEWERTAVSTERGPDDEAAGAQRRAQIARSLEALSEQHRSIIILSDIEGLAYREIAEVLGIPMGTVMSRLHHARKRLREILGAGFAGLLLVVALLAAAAPPLEAQGPPPGPLSPIPAPPVATQQVCVYALVMLASNAPGVPPGARTIPAPPRRPGTAPSAGLTPTPDLKGDDSPPPPPAPGSGCGQPVRLRPWVPRLQGVFGYSNYEPMSAFETSMPVGVAQRFALPGGRELEIQPVAIRTPVVRMLVKVTRGGVVEIATVMDVPPRRPALIGGPPYGPGVLIIVIHSRIE